MTTTLAHLHPGDRARVCGIGLEDGIRRRLLDIGLTIGAEVECAGQSPFGSPGMYIIQEALIAIRKSDGEKVLVNSLEEVTQPWD
jgi:Fe2+ transport system protein FeoA